VTASETGDGSQASVGKLMDLGGAVAVVTGGATGIGAAICRRLGELGAAIVVADLAGGSASAMVERLGVEGTKAVAVEGDVRSPAVARQAMEAAVARLGGLGILVNCAGVYPSIPALGMTEQEWDDILDVNLKGTFLCAQAFAAAQADRGVPGVIVNIASRAGLRARPGQLAYSAAKAGVVALTQGLAQELAPLGIRVNAVAPGPIQTGRTASAAVAKVAGTGQSAEEWQAAYRARIPLGRFGTPDEVALAVAFLAGGASSYSTGSVLVVDGGATLP
jgi:NAD(P)-dependent dehydrogenase (short-subunit alcohol dehydrogenase family)